MPAKIAADAPLGLLANAHVVAATPHLPAQVRGLGRAVSLSEVELAVVALLDGKRTLGQLLEAAPRPLLALDVVRRLGECGLLGQAAAPQPVAGQAARRAWAVDLAMVLGAYAIAVGLAAVVGALDGTLAVAMLGWTAVAALAWHSAPFLPGWGRRRAGAFLGVPDAGRRLRTWLMRRSVRNTLRTGDIDRVEQRYLLLSAWAFCHGFAVVVLAIGWALPLATQFALHGLPGQAGVWAALLRALPLLATVAVCAPPLGMLLLVLFWLVPQLLPRASARPERADAVDGELAGRFADALGALPAFAPLGRDRLLQLGKLGRLEVHADRAVVLRQGEKGDRLCWLAAGRVRVRVEDESGLDHEVTVLHGGAFFGETALLEPVARTATVIADGPVQIVALGRSAFLGALHELGADSEGVKDQLRTAAVLRNHPLFCALDADGLRALLSAADVVHLRAGQAAVRQGDAGDTLFVVREGSFEVRRESRGRARKLARLRPGDWFGELALLGDGRRTASVVACSDAVVVQVPRPVVEGAVLRDVTAALHVLEAASERLAALRQEEGL
ncbi:MAG: cyclic nucleotide-binding domain-containing protein [Deltaproteobacteria bacterium]|nr:cyclic nucleotide-binding domain-containing protein [Deltaproteobacteria bacterium]